MNTRAPLEKTIEAKFVKLAQARGCQCLKLNVIGRRSWPDRLVLVPGGKVLFIEFKRPGGLLTPGQELLHADLYAMGHEVHVCYTVEDALDLI